MYENNNTIYANFVIMGFKDVKMYKVLFLIRIIREFVMKS